MDAESVGRVHDVRVVLVEKLTEAEWRAVLYAIKGSLNAEIGELVETEWQRLVRA